MRSNLIKWFTEWIFQLPQILYAVDLIWIGPVAAETQFTISPGPSKVYMR